MGSATQESKEGAVADAGGRGRVKLREWRLLVGGPRVNGSVRQGTGIWTRPDKQQPAARM